MNSPSRRAGTLRSVVCAILRKHGLTDADIRSTLKLLNAPEPIWVRPTIAPVKPATPAPLKREGGAA